MFKWIFFVRALIPEIFFLLDVPWRSCNNYWNTPYCVNPYDRKNLLCWDSYTSGVPTKLCQLNQYNLTLKEMSDPVKEFWE